MKIIPNFVKKIILNSKKIEGITLVALVLTIVIMLILAGITLNLTIGENGVLLKAKNASITQKFATYKEATELIMDPSLTIAGNEIANYLPSITEEDINKFAIVNGELSYLGNNEQEILIANSLKISTTENSNVEDIVKIKDEVLNLGDSVELPTNDNESTPTVLVGTRLYDKNTINGERWNLIITYNSNNQEIARYGSGYYYLTPETTTLDLKGAYVVNYKTKQLRGLTNYKNWNINSTLAVSDGLALNIDPTNLADGNWTGIIKHGDVEYSSSDKALLFNESTSNTLGEGGYLETTRNGIDFSNGFTFEMYFNADRILYKRYNYDPSQYTLRHSGFGLFCRMPSLESSFKNAMRFGYTDDNYICKFYQAPIGYITPIEGNKIRMSNHGSVDTVASNPGYVANTDVYLTFVYKKEASADIVEYYINGEKYGTTNYYSEYYKEGLKSWNKDSCPFFIGVCPWFKDGNLYYLKGKVYSTRLYTTAMTEEQVMANRNATMQYRASF